MIYFTSKFPQIMKNKICYAFTFYQSYVSLEQQWDVLLFIITTIKIVSHRCIMG